MVEAQCVRCGREFISQEPNVCMVCGRDLCDRCYDESPYCDECAEDVSPPIRPMRPPIHRLLLLQGECVECGRDSLRLSINGYCEGCVMQAAIDAQEP